MEQKDLEQLIKEIKSPNTPEQKLAQAACDILNQVLPETNPLSGVIKTTLLEDEQPMRLKKIGDMKNPTMGVDGKIYVNEMHGHEFLYLDSTIIESDVGVAKKALSINAIQTIVGRVVEDLNMQNMDLTLSILANASANKNIIKINHFEKDLISLLKEGEFTHLFCSPSLQKRFEMPVFTAGEGLVIKILEMGKSSYINNFFKQCYSKDFDVKKDEFFFTFNSKEECVSQKMIYSVKWKIQPSDSDKINIKFYQEIAWALDSNEVQGFII